MNCAPMGRPVLARIFTSTVSFTKIDWFRADGCQTRVSSSWVYEPCDIAIMYGLANPVRTSPQGRLRNAIYREHKGPIVVIESSIIGRGFRPRSRWLTFFRREPLRPRQHHPYFRLAVGGGLGDDADFNAANSPPDRWERMSTELGLTLRPYRQAGDHVLLIGQVPRDASLRGMSVSQWLIESALELRKHTDRPIVVRLHPSMKWRFARPIVEKLTAIPGVTVSPHGSSLTVDLNGAWVCVTYSSGAAIDALIAGIPAICVSSASMAYRICSNRLADVETPLLAPREQFLYDLAYSQWSIEELSDGTAWMHLMPAVLRSMTVNAS